MTRLALLLGGAQAAAQWTNARVHQLVVGARLDPNTALDLVEHGIAEDDPVILAEPGQVWVRRTEADPGLPAVLYLTHRLGPEHLVAEDGGPTGTGVIPLALLYAYELDYWKHS
ncbi:hypothetical protein [Streptomyces malaysiensis]|uniref:hypothetical protein n=1 Tax=Streptomyces malaysiensis TaxID=92644 RepID=UPI000BFBD03D|nr:hypothetical protein [Streptomyces malaysiensis]ATL88758.1 hypothetical protein SMALA_8612 [Streptomyces malaysiensis]